MKTLMVLLALLIGSVAMADPPDTLWTRTYSYYFNRGTALDGVAPLPDGEFYVSGHCCYNLYHTFWVAAYVARMDAYGNPEWSNRFGGSGAMLGGKAYDIKALPDGGCVAGFANGIGYLAMEPTLVRMDENGALLWSSSPDPTDWMYGRDTLAAVCALAGGRFAATGFFMDTSRVFMTDSGGNNLWSKSFYPIRLHSISAGSDSSFVVAGGDAYFIARLSFAGDTLWTRQFMVGPYSRCRQVITTPSGNYLMVGGSGEVGFSGSAAMISADGERLWMQYYDFSPEIVSVDHCAEGGYILLSDRLIRVNDGGDTLWTRSLPCDSCVYKSVAHTPDSGYVVAGYAGARWDGFGYLARFAREGLAVDRRITTHPQSFSLFSYPNPFNPATTLSFTLPKAGMTTLAVYNITGRTVQTLQSGMLDAGEHNLKFDGAVLPSGLYFARIESGEYRATQKLLLLK